MKIHVLTIFPEIIDYFSTWSIIGKAMENGRFEINSVDIREFSKNKHKKVDDYPFGGGSGMLMTPQPIYDAINSVKKPNSKVIFLSPQGKTYDQDKAIDLSKEEELILLCGHYEGIDNRIIENYVDEEISMGDFVLTGGEIPAMALIESVVRLLPDVLSTEDSYKEESHYNGLLEYPQYTRPREFNGSQVPEVLLSGNHKKIEQWRKIQSIKATLDKRPDLLDKLELSHEDEKIILDIKKSKY